MKLFSPVKFFGIFWEGLGLVQFSRSVVSNSLWPHELQHARPPCPSPTPGFHPNPCPLSQWRHTNISSSVVPFSSCPQSFPASGSFKMSQLFASGGQSIGVSASTFMFGRIPPLTLSGLGLLFGESFFFFFFDYWLNCKRILIINLFRLSVPFWFSLGRLYVHYYSVVQLVGI